MQSIGKKILIDDQSDNNSVVDKAVVTNLASSGDNILNNAMINSLT